MKREIDWESKYKLLCNELMQKLTPGGSEFYMDPERCLSFAEEIRRSERDLLKKYICRSQNNGLIHRLWSKMKRKEKP